MKTNFLGSSGQNTFQVTQELPVGTSLDALAEASEPVEQVIRETEGVETVQTVDRLRRPRARGGARRRRRRHGHVLGHDRRGRRPGCALQAEVRSELDDLDDVGEITLAASSGFGASNDIEVDVHRVERGGPAGGHRRRAGGARRARLARADLVATSSESAPLRRGRGEPHGCRGGRLLRGRPRRLRLGGDAAAVGGLGRDRRRRRSRSTSRARTRPPRSRSSRRSRCRRRRASCALDTLATVEEVDGPVVRHDRAGPAQRDGVGDAERRGPRHGQRRGDGRGRRPSTCPPARPPRSAASPPTRPSRSRSSGSRCSRRSSSCTS